MKLWRKIKKILDLFSGADTSLYAASCCHYLIISLIPSSLLVFSLISEFPFAAKWDIWLRQIMPKPLYPILRNIIYYVGKHHTIGLLSISGLVTIWSASKGILAVRRGLNRAMMNISPKSFLFDRIRAICTLLPMFLLWIGIMIFNMHGDQIYFLLHAIMPGLTRMIANVVEFRYTYSTIVLFLLFSIMYKIVPTASHPFRFCMAGAAFSATVWQVLTVLFSIYIEWFSSYEKVYGSFGLILLGLIWLQISIRIILLGGRFLHLLSSDQFHPIQILRSDFPE